MKKHFLWIFLFLMVVFLTSGCKLTLSGITAPVEALPGQTITVDLEGSTSNQEYGYWGSEYGLILQVPQGAKVLSAKAYFSFSTPKSYNLSKNSQYEALYTPETGHEIWVGTATEESDLEPAIGSATVQILLGNQEGEYHIKAAVGSYRNDSWNTDDPQGEFDFKNIVDKQYVHKVVITGGTASQHFVSRDGDCGGNTRCYSTIQEAIDAAPDGSEILVRQGTYEESISLTSGKSLVVKGGYDAAYSQQTPNTTFIRGLGQTSIQAPSGSLKFQMISIRPGGEGGYTLTITTTGQGGGDVQVSPPGTVFEPGTAVTLTAEADLGSVFTGWGGACSGTELTTQVTMNADKEVSANFAPASTDPLDHQAVLGPLAGATIRAYTLDDLSEPIEGPFLSNNSVNMQASGSFDLTLNGISDDTWILVSATGGWDIDADDDGSVDANPTNNQGTLHALARASQWRQGNFKVNALTDMAWRYSEAWVGQTSLTELEKRLNEVAQTLLVNKISGTGEVDYANLFAFNPGDTSHRDCLSFDYADILASGGYVSQVHAGAADADVNAALDTVFGSVLSFVLPDDLESEVQVRLAGFGRGKVQSDDGLLVVDSEADDSAQRTLALYERDRETPVTFTGSSSSRRKFLMI